MAIFLDSFTIIGDRNLYNCDYQKNCHKFPGSRKKNDNFVRLIASDVMAKTKKEESTGYVYIFTNPSYRNDWVKVGRTDNVDKRLKELYTTSVPLPFEVYATVQTIEYKKLEMDVHRMLDRVAKKRISERREFFNVTPEDALEALTLLSERIPDAVVTLKGEVLSPEPTSEPEETEPLSPEPTVVTKPKAAKSAKSSPKKSKTKTPSSIQIHSDSEMTKGARFSLDKKSFYSLSAFVPMFVRRYVNDRPSMSYKELKELFIDTLLDSHFKYCGLLATMSDITSSNVNEKKRKEAYHYDRPDAGVESSDKVRFYVSNQWTRDSFRSIIQIAESAGYSVYMSVK